MFTQTLEEMLVLAFKRGMSFKQVRERVPPIAAKKLNMSVAEFHAELERIEGRDGLNAIVNKVVSQFTPSEQREIARRRF